MKILKPNISLLIWTLIIFSFIKCSYPHCRKKEIPDPQPTGTEIVSWSDKSTASISSTLAHEFFTDDLTGYIVGYGGVIYKTTDGFTSFTTLTSGTTQNLVGVWFTDANTGYVVGNAGTILKTTNAGSTWTPLPSPTPANFSDVFFVGPFTGYITGSAGTILKTTNAGVSWTILSSGSSSDLHGLYFTDANTGVVSGQSFTIIKTIDGGTTWYPVHSDLTGGTVVTPLASIYFTDANTGYCVGGYNYATGVPSTNGVILKTTDGGENWFSKANPAGTDFLASVKFFNANTGYIAAGNIPNNTSTILKTTDGGETWIIQSTSSHRLSDIFLVHSGAGYSVGLNGALLKGNQ
jgi:photosystem II stability/assembly factor-like uncharacterized protein